MSRRHSADMRNKLAMFQQGSQSDSNKCAVCKKNAYANEQLKVEGIVYHKVCFRCTECSTKLRVGNYAGIDGVVYCKPHFKQLFASSGGKYNMGSTSGRRSKTPNPKTRGHTRSKSDVQILSASKATSPLRVRSSTLKAPIVPERRGRRKSMVEDKLKIFQQDEKEAKQHTIDQSESKEEPKFSEIMSGRCKFCYDKIDEDGILVGENTYHRACFACLKCKFELNPQNYCITDQGLFFCDQHKPGQKSAATTITVTKPDEDTVSNPSNSAATSDGAAPEDVDLNASESLEKDTNEDVDSEELSSLHPTPPQLEIVSKGICKLCYSKVTDFKNGVVADGSTFHYGCFECLMCKTKLSADNFNITELGPFCLQHGLRSSPLKPRLNMVSPRKPPVVKVFEEPPENDDEPEEQQEQNVLEPHIESPRSPPISPGPSLSLGIGRVICKLCFGPIKSNTVEVDEMVFHKDCFKCLKCSVELTPSTYHVTALGPFCLSHGRPKGELEAKQARVTSGSDTGAPRDTVNAVSGVELKDAGPGDAPQEEAGVGVGLTITSHQAGDDVPKVTTVTPTSEQKLKGEDSSRQAGEKLEAETAAAKTVAKTAAKTNIEIEADSTSESESESEEAADNIHRIKASAAAASARKNGRGRGRGEQSETTETDTHSNGENDQNDRFEQCQVCDACVIS